MHVHVDFCLIPLGVGVSLTPYIACCQQILSARDLTFQLHAYGTNIEGDWQSVFAAVEACHQAIHDMGAPRSSSTLKLGTRADKPQTLQDKIDSVQHHLDAS